MENQIAWKTASLISRKCTYELRCNGLEFCSRRISCFHAFWCFPRPILAIFHIANVFLSGNIIITITHKKNVFLGCLLSFQGVLWWGIILKLAGDGCSADHLSIQNSFCSVPIWAGLGGCFLIHGSQCTVLSLA